MYDCRTPQTLVKIHIHVWLHDDTTDAGKGTDTCMIAYRHHRLWLRYICPCIIACRHKWIKYAFWSKWLNWWQIKLIITKYYIVDHLNLFSDFTSLNNLDPQLLVNRQQNSYVDVRIDKVCKLIYNREQRGARACM